MTCKTTIALLVATLLGPLALPAEARADRRIFAQTYGYATLPQGAKELEHYADAGTFHLTDPGDPDAGEKLVVDWKHQLELEYGITNRLDLGIYQVFRQKPFEAFRYEGFKVRSRYRFAEEGALPVDVAIYLEVAWYVDEVAIEQRLILARRIGPVEVATNLKVEQEIEGGAVEVVLAPMGGVGWHVTDAIALGVEYHGRTAFEGGTGSPFTHHLGPAASVRARGWYWTVSALPRLAGDDSRPEVMVRSLLGLLF
ncbi:MAG: hypothetical protein JRI25_08120 [Deltaproteobacteria bacterium]|nr:hypothetical protein [Deltaproteobacteria bacterium]MBW2254550.1 hypothetical protein [Deltaproteobacteria bacterium]